MKGHLDYGFITRERCYREFTSEKTVIYVIKLVQKVDVFVLLEFPFMSRNFCYVMFFPKKCSDMIWNIYMESVWLMGFVSLLLQMFKNFK